jgi:hypothetical protein
MAVPSSGEITLVGIFSEKNENDYTANNPDGETDFSLAGLSRNNIDDSSGGEININANASPKPDDSAPFRMSEFYGYDHDAVGTSFSSMYSAFSQAILTTTAAAYSLVRTFVVVNGSGAVTVSIGSIAPNSGTLSVAASSTGDPGTSGTDNSGTGWVTEGTTLSHTPTLWSQSGTTIYLRFRVNPAPSATSDVRTVTISNNGASTSGGDVTIVTNAPKSDMRLKTNIDRIGYSDMNIPIYLFNYKNDLNTTYKGVMAQDLLELGFDSSVILDSDGYYSVDYNSIDVDMERV